MSLPYRFLGLLALALPPLSCTDPVPGAAVARLGGEADGVSPGPLHRRGQPCLVCHSARGPASNKPFAIAGTVFENAADDAKPAARVKIVLRDSENAPGGAETNEVGNFYIRESEWPDPAFPLKVGIERDGKRAEMSSTINREGSCSFCHKPVTKSRYALESDEPRTSIGPVIFEGAQ